MFRKWKNKIFKFLSFGEVDYINGSETLAAPLLKEEEDKYVLENMQGSIEARNKLIEHNLRLVVYVAKRYETNSYNLEDLISIGTLGLIKGVKTFKPDKNIKLATYASRCIENEILMFLRKKSRSKVEVSIDEPLNVDYDGNELALADVIGTEAYYISEDYSMKESKDKVKEAIQTLKKREQLILNLRYGLNNNPEMTQKEVADYLNISQSYISRLEKKIIKKLKVKITS
ncbi:MAG: sigma-70 family RNA polymerase sigma factor [Erysipelotrichaceae bacterium]|nr:sigma-70 family RNA polymerase sigma factor [Erysipelotrichaceae bacterium]